jgi:hypothetical protein
MNFSDDRRLTIHVAVHVPVVHGHDCDAISAVMDQATAPATPIDEHGLDRL